MGIYSPGKALVVYDMSKHVCIGHCQNCLPRERKAVVRACCTFPTAPSPVTTHYSHHISLLPSVYYPFEHTFSDCVAGVAISKLYSRMPFTSRTLLLIGRQLPGRRSCILATVLTTASSVRSSDHFNSRSFLATLYSPRGSDLTSHRLARSLATQQHRLPFLPAAFDSLRVGDGLSTRIWMRHTAEVMAVL